MRDRRSRRPISKPSDSIFRSRSSSTIGISAARRASPARTGSPVGETFDEAEAIARIRATAGVEIGDVLLNAARHGGRRKRLQVGSALRLRCQPVPVLAALSDGELRGNSSQTARRFLRRTSAGELAPMTTYTGFRRTTRATIRASGSRSTAARACRAGGAGPPSSVRAQGPGREADVLVSRDVRRRTQKSEVRSLQNDTCWSRQMGPPTLLSPWLALLGRRRLRRQRPSTVTIASCPGG